MLLVDGRTSELVEINLRLPSYYLRERNRLFIIEEIKKLKPVFYANTRAYFDDFKKWGWATY